jgi:hypothetical protein
MAWHGRFLMLGVARHPQRGKHTFRFLKGSLGLTAAKVRTPGQADRWVRLVMAAYAQLLIARTGTGDLRRPWKNHRTPTGPAPPGGSAADFPTSAGTSAPPHMSLNPDDPDPDDPKAPPAARHPATRSPRKAASSTNKTALPRRSQAKT